MLQIIDLKDTDAPEAFDQLSALVALHDKDASLDDRGRETIAAAKAYIPVFRISSDETKQETRRKIESGIARAKSADSPEQAVKIYESIIKLYAEDQWVEDLIEKTKTHLAELKKD